MPVKSTAEKFIDRVDALAKTEVENPEFATINLMIEHDTRGRYPTITIRVKDETKRIRRKRRTRGEDE